MLPEFEPSCLNAWSSHTLYSSVIIILSHSKTMLNFYLSKFKLRWQKSTSLTYRAPHSQTLITSLFKTSYISEKRVENTGRNIFVPLFNKKKRNAPTLPRSPS